jgi:hypothetical protein
MSVFSMAGSNPALPTYPLQRSVRLRSSASAYFNRTPAAAGNQKTFTLSCWFKGLPPSAANAQIFSTPITTGPNAGSYITFASGTLGVINFVAGATDTGVVTTQVFRDPSAWYHIVIAVDTTQATSTNRVKFYINGVQVTAFGTTIYPTLNSNFNFNSTVAHLIGAANVTSSISQFLDGYLEEINFIDGQALTPSSFGAYNSYGVWSPAKYTGSYGTNGFYLNFQDNSAVTTTANIGIGADSSGNGNYWTSNNISLTAGATYDSMLDVPTNTSPTNANYTVLSPLVTGNVSAPIAGNLQAYLPASSNAYYNFVGTVGVTSGKWYWENTLVVKDASAGQWIQVGIVSATTTYTNNALGFTGNMSAGYAYYNDGFKAGNTVTASYGASFTTGDVIGIAFDADNGTITFYKNGTSQGQAFTGISNAVPWLPIIQMYRSTGTSQTAAINFGQQPFAYTVPTGYARLNTYNLPDSIVPVGAQYMAATTYTGNGVATPNALVVTNTVNGKSFQPDFVWVKSRSLAQGHVLEDSVRGTSVFLQTDTTAADQATGGGDISSFNSNGFTLSYGNARTNQNAATYVGWQWRASNASAVTNTAGSITSSVSANQTAGFSIVTYTGTGANATVGHGLGVAPRMMIIKRRNSTSNWPVYHASISGSPDNFLYLNSTSAVINAGVVFNGVTPNSTTFGVGTDAIVNASGGTYVGYMFAAVPGYSAFGSYTGNGSNDGPFVYLGFRPRWVMIKCSTSDFAGNAQWNIFDTSRSTSNTSLLRLFANSSAVEATTIGIDILSNGFKLRESSTAFNGSGATYIYMAFAENPFKNALAR